MIDSREVESLVSDLVRRAWLPWIGLVAVCCLIGTFAWRYRHADKPSKSAKVAVSKPAAEASLGPATATVVHESQTKMPDGFRVFVVGKRLEYVGNPNQLTSAGKVSYEVIQDVATACEAIVTEVYEKEKPVAEQKTLLRSSNGSLVTPRPTSVFVRLEYAGRSVENSVEVPISPNGRNRLWGLAVKLVDLKLDDAIVDTPAPEDPAQKSAD